MTGPDPIVDANYDFRTFDRSIQKTISFRRVTPERDLGRLHAWLGSTHVKPYWQLDQPLPAFRDSLAAKLDDNHLTPYVGCLDHVSMSYWECYWTAEDDLANHYDAEANDRGIHLLIGPNEYLGEGYAVPLMRAVVAMLFRHPATDRVVAEPDARNDRAIRVFERCGFEPQMEFYFEEAEKDALLVVCNRDEFELDVLKETPALPREVTPDV